MLITYWLTVARLGRSLFIITAPSTRQVLVLLHLFYCSAMWSGATKRDFAFGTGQHGWPLHLHRQLILIVCMSISPGSKWGRDWLHHYLCLWEVLPCLIHRACLSELLAHAAQTLIHTPDMPPEVSSQSPIWLWEPNRAMTVWRWRRRGMAAVSLALTNCTVFVFCIIRN
jgi:hypothetical protein